MVYYSMQATKDVGIGNVVTFATEQHPKKRENKIGFLTLQVYQHTEGNAAPAKMMIKCSKIDPVLKGVIGKEFSVVGAHKDALHKHINAYLCRQYQSLSQSSEAGMSALSDSLYVLGVQMTPHESEVSGSSYTLFSAWDSSSKAVAGPAAAPAAKKARFDKPDKTPKNEGTRVKNTNVEIKFCRVEDVPLIMQACRVFFRQMQSSSGRIVVEFPRGELPMWWKLLHDVAFDFKKTRDAFDNVEVVEQLRTRSGLHFFTCFSIADADISFTTRLKAADGAAWVPVVYVEFSKLMLHEGHTMKPRLHDMGC